MYASKIMEQFILLSCAYTTVKPVQILSAQQYYFILQKQLTYQSLPFCQP